MTNKGRNKHRLISFWQNTVFMGEYFVIRQNELIIYLCKSAFCFYFYCHTRRSRWIFRGRTGGDGWGRVSGLKIQTSLGFSRINIQVSCSDWIWDSHRELRLLIGLNTSLRMSAYFENLTRKVYLDSCTYVSYDTWSLLRKVGYLCTRAYEIIWCICCFKWRALLPISLWRNGPFALCGTLTQC